MISKKHNIQSVHNQTWRGHMARFNTRCRYLIVDYMLTEQDAYSLRDTVMLSLTGWLSAHQPPRKQKS